MLDSAAPSSSANRKLNRAATAAKAVLTDFGRIACLPRQLDEGARSLRQATRVMPDYAGAHVNRGSVGRTPEAAYQFGATLNLQHCHRHDIDPGAFAVAASA
jgi:hypothetical protein